MSFCSFQFPSKSLMVPSHVSMVLPDCPQSENAKEFYASGRKYPVLWLLHGSCNDENSWFLNTNIARYATEKNVIVVCAGLLNSDYSNYGTFADGFNTWDYYFDELMPLVYGWFPASRKKEDNFIAGLSMGGNGALMMGLGHPELFEGIGILSSTAREVEYLRPYAAMKGSELREKLLSNPSFLPGPNGEGMRLKEINQVTKYPTVQAFLDSPENAWDRFAEVAKAGKMPRLFVSCGTADTHVYPRFLRFKEYAKRLGVRGTFVETEGYGHEYALWDQMIQKVLEFWLQ